jgi:hypothetical protein
MNPKIMYVEYKGDGLAGSAWITRVSFSKTGKSIYFDGRTLETLDGRGYKANYFDVATGARYWISGPRKDGKDSLYPNTVEIDDDVREEYWLKIRKRPDLAAETSFRSGGKYTKRGRGSSSQNQISLKPGKAKRNSRSSKN